jgi:atypical dual specificity phosphatase
MGISRSATVICAYLIATTKMTAREALAAVREKRGMVSPNMGFLRQLEEYATEVQGGGRSRAGTPRPTKVGDNVAEAIRKLTKGSQKELIPIPTNTVPMTGMAPSSSATFSMGS